MVKLLLVENLASRLVPALAGSYPSSEHVGVVGVAGAQDRAIWDYARDRDFVIVSKDHDFLDLSVLLGQPPKVVWIGLGNCCTDDVIDLLRRSRAVIERFIADSGLGFLALR